MLVSLKVRGELRRYLAGKELLDLEVPEGLPVSQAIGQAGIPMDEVWLVVLNGTVVEGDPPLAEGDRIEVVSPIAGG